MEYLAPMERDLRAVQCAAMDLMDLVVILVPVTSSVCSLLQFFNSASDSDSLESSVYQSFTLMQYSIIHSQSSVKSL
jgi:hypothetical protein